MRWLRVLVGLSVGMAIGSAHADELTVPAALQAKLLARAAAYDRNFAKRSADKARIFVVVTTGAAATQFSGQLRQALGEETVVGGVAHEEVEVHFATSAALAEKVKSEKPSIVFLGPGFAEADVKAVVAALAGVEVLTVTANPQWVGAGVSLGFDLVSGKPRLLVNLKQAHKQGVAFGADLLRLAQVIEP